MFQVLWTKQGCWLELNVVKAFPWCCVPTYLGWLVDGENCHLLPAMRSGLSRTLGAGILSSYNSPGGRSLRDAKIRSNIDPDATKLLFVSRSNLRGYMECKQRR